MFFLSVTLGSCESIDPLVLLTPKDVEDVGEMVKSRVALVRTALATIVGMILAAWVFHLHHSSLACSMSTAAFFHGSCQGVLAHYFVAGSAILTISCGHVIFFLFTLCGHCIPIVFCIGMYLEDEAIK